MNNKVICQVCGISLKELTQHLNKKHNMTKEYYLNKYPGSKLVCEETKIKKASMLGRKRPEQSKLMLENNPMKGKKRTQSEKELMSKNRTGKGIGVAGKYKRTKEIREKISDSVSRLYIDGKFRFNTGHYTSTKMYKTYYYRSSWEHEVMKYLDFNDEIKSWEHESIRIPYIDENGDNRIYIPDFLVTFNCGIKELWEIKPKDLLTFDRNLCKLKGLNKFIKNNDVNGFVIDEFILEKMKKYTKGIDEKIY